MATIIKRVEVISNGEVVEYSENSVYSSRRKDAVDILDKVWREERLAGGVLVDREENECSHNKGAECCGIFTSFHYKR